jgi:GNAT superfamily N-acetyltransferase
VLKGGNRDFVFREVRPDDKTQVVAFTAHTWEFGDYIEDVFDRWLADDNGLFLAAEHCSSGRIAAIDKLTFPTPTEAWFEGLRVNPEFRRRGLATDLQHFMIEQARMRGAACVRFLTLIGNTPIRRNAYRGGFMLRNVVRYWHREPDSPGLTATAVSGGPHRLRPAREDEAIKLRDWWLRSSAFRTAGLAQRDWKFFTPTESDWLAAAREGLLLVGDSDAPENSMPPPMLLLIRSVNDTVEHWTISIASALAEQWAGLGGGLIEYATERGVPEVDGLLPDSYDIVSGLQAAGLTPDADDERLCLFELDLNAPR